MTYASIMVSVDLAGHAAARIRIAAHLADDFGALLIGVAAQRPDHAAAPVGPTGASPCFLPESLERTQGLIARSHEHFRDATQGRGRVEWRSEPVSPFHYLVEQARAADLIILGRPAAGDSAHHRDVVDPGEFVMSAGRPVLVTPPGVDYLEAQRVVIAWKDTREARRAVFDAMPLLKRAKYVNVVALRESDHPTGAQDVARYLQGHGVQGTVAERWIVGNTSEALVDLTSECGADLIVMGAYGHGRLREWMFGGVTRDLLASAPVCCLMSH